LVSDPERSLTRRASGPEGRWPERASGPEGKGRQGGIFKTLKYYKFPYLQLREKALKETQIKWKSSSESIV
jgi:hypothetical protein